MGGWPGIRNSAAVALLLACGPVPTEVALETEDQKTLYAMGLALAQSLENLPLTGEEVVLVERGLSDALALREPRVDLNEYRTQIVSFRTERLSREQRAAGQAFLAGALETPGALQTESGLVFSELEAGDGASPTPESTVEVHYHGTLVDGTVFDSSLQRGRPTTFPLNRVIPCWTEGLQRMKVGGKSRLVCPPEIAYGDRGAPPLILPGATLVFDIQLLSIQE